MIAGFPQRHFLCPIQLGALADELVAASSKPRMERQGWDRVGKIKVGYLIFLLSN